MDQKITELYDAYKQDLIDRRKFLQKLAFFVGGMAAANALLPLLENHQAHAAFLHTVEDAGTALAHPVSKRRRSQSRSR